MHFFKSAMGSYNFFFCQKQILDCSRSNELLGYLLPVQEGVLLTRPIPSPSLSPCTYLRLFKAPKNKTTPHPLQHSCETRTLPVERVATGCSDRDAFHWIIVDDKQRKSQLESTQTFHNTESSYSLTPSHSRHRVQSISQIFSCRFCCHVNGSGR